MNTHLNSVSNQAHRNDASRPAETRGSQVPALSLNNSVQELTPSELVAVTGGEGVYKQMDRCSAYLCQAFSAPSNFEEIKIT